MISSFCDQNRISYEKNLPLSTCTTFRIGGPADLAVMPGSVDELRKVLLYLKERKLRYFVLGRGSDILAADEGFRGVILLTKKLNSLSCNGNRIYAGAGCSMASVSNHAWQNSLAGLEFLHGIPGSIGGGVFMNAGAYGSELATYLESVEWMDEDGNLRSSDPRDLSFSYRHSYFSDHFGIVTGVVLHCEKGDASLIKETMNDLDSRRREKQPLEYPSAGSAFKRPEGYFAGKLIEDCGLKGFCCGGACISEKHAGFIVNKGGATAKDVKDLISHVSDTVFDRFSVRLEPEIRFLEEK